MFERVKERIKKSQFQLAIIVAVFSFNAASSSSASTQATPSLSSLLQRLEGNWEENKTEAIPVDRGLTLHSDRTLEVRTYRPALDANGNEIACKVTWFGKVIKASRTDVFGARPISAKGQNVLFFAYNIKNIVLSPEQDNENIELCAEIVAEQNAILNSPKHKEYRSRFPAYISTRFQNSKKFLLDIGLHGEQVPFEKTI